MTEQAAKLVNQVERAKEYQELLRGQLGDVQTEVDIIYEVGCLSSPFFHILIRSGI
jgi:hypothetical protein